MASKDGNSLWVTDEFGSLYVFDVNNPLSDSSTIKFRLSARSNTTMECRSSVSLHETGNGVEYAVYTVIDTPKANQDFNASRYVYCIHMQISSVMYPYTACMRILRAHDNIRFRSHQGHDCLFLSF